MSVELVHLGSLYHDDVMDEAATRRTVDSVNARWGNLKAILAGDFLLARASEIAASLGTEVAGLLAATIGRLCEGQVRELRNMFDVDRTEEAYLASIAARRPRCSPPPAASAASSPATPGRAIDRLTEFGEHYGMAFQIVDDILDVVATDEELGKPSGNDLVEGIYTLAGHPHAGQRRRRAAPPGAGPPARRRPRWTRPARWSAPTAPSAPRSPPPGSTWTGALDALAPLGDTAGARALGRGRRPPAGLHPDRPGLIGPEPARGAAPPLGRRSVERFWQAVQKVAVRPSHTRLTSTAPQRRQALARPAVAVEVVLVVARAAVDAPVVAQRGSPALERGAQHVPQRAVQPLGLGPGERSAPPGTRRPATGPRPRRCCRPPPPAAG